METKEMVAALCTLPGPSGFEGAAAQRCAQMLAPLVDHIETDRLGNVIGKKSCHKPGAKKLLLDAHIDEIGLMVTGHEKGFLRFRAIGGVDPRMLPGRELKILAEKPLSGVVAWLPVHLLSEESMEHSVKIQDLFIDAGLSEQEAVRQIPIGTPVVFADGCEEIQPGILCSKALDDRACFVVLMRALELLKDRSLNVDLVVLGSVQEELGTRGAITGAYAIAPDYCIAVDVTHAKTPDAPREKVFDMGGGTAIGLGPNINRWIGERLIKTAQAHEIKYQLEVMEGHTGTNAWPVQISREGVATGVVSVPVKYMHSPVEMLNVDDIESAARLLAEFAAGLDGEVREHA